MLHVDELKERLSYNPDTGVFTWASIPSRNSRSKVGGLAGATDTKGYRVIKLSGKLYKAHRLAFLYMTGEWPNHMVDHCDGDPGNNAWNNLREANSSQNQANKRPCGKSGVKGVVWHRRCRKWQAQLTSYGQTIYLGQYDTVAEAAAMYASAAIDIHGDYARVS